MNAERTASVLVGRNELEEIRIILVPIPPDELPSTKDAAVATMPKL
jgi:hypothetical protein